MEIDNSEFGPHASEEQQETMETLTADSFANIRRATKDKIIAALLPGHILQVCGPPMAGKSTLVKQTIDSSDSQLCFRSHNFMCENLRSSHDVLKMMADTLDTQPATESFANINEIITLLSSKLRIFPNSHHILVFQKCEGLHSRASRANSQGHHPLDFMQQIVRVLSKTFKLSIVFTSSKKFPLTELTSGIVEVGVLDFWDITTILHMYAPNVDVISYASVCVDTIPIPRAVRLLAEEFLTGIPRNHLQSPEEIEKRLDEDENFLSRVFESKLGSVETWILEKNLTRIMHFCQHIGSSFTKDHLEFITGSHKIFKLIDYLRQNYAVWALPETDRWVIHPLLIYYWKVRCHRDRTVTQGKWYDHSCNKFTDFMCRLLQRTEMNMVMYENKGRVYGCLHHEWPNIRHVIEIALNCNENTCKTFLKAAVSARSLMLKCFNAEAFEMYKALLDTPETFFTVSERAMIEALVGHCSASTAVLARGGTWKQAEDYLDSAIMKLRKHGPPFALMWAIYRKGIILFRQSKYKEAQWCFKNAKRVIVVEEDDSEIDRIFGVSKLQVREEKITRDIFAANTLCFLGENKMAQEMLEECLEEMEDEFADHPELATLLNSLGLVEQRGHGDMNKALEWYMKSYNERKEHAKFGREILLVSLNNISTIYQMLGKHAESRKYLEEALSIRREYGWIHAHTALTLTHLGFLNFKQGDIIQAFLNMQDADEILQKILINHDTRLRINNGLGHLSQILKMQGQEQEKVKIDKSPEQYFDNALEVANRITGNLSDDGYHHLFIAHEHKMLMALEGSKEEYNKHKNEILPYFEVKQGVGKKVFIPNERIPKHMDLYRYFSTTEYEDINKQVFEHHLCKACEFCQVANNDNNNPINWY